MQAPETQLPEVDAVTLAVMRGQLDAVAEEIQNAVLKSSFSTIVTEAKDATSAVFDAQGRTIAQACAIPLHLGALGALGRRFAEAFPADVARDGDLYMMNDPYSGGTHLPDIGVGAPVIWNDQLIGYVATMTHHQDIGGSTPGSAAANAYDHLAEGIRIPMLRLATAGVIDTDVIDLMTANSRSPRNMRGDLEAQIAGCRTGEPRLRAIFEAWGAETVQRGIDSLLDYAERVTRLAIERIPDGEYTFADWLDDDGLDPDSDPVEIRVTLRVRGSDVEFDFTGTAPQVKAAINCVPSSTLSAVYYAIRALTGDAAPNNDGCNRPISAVLPPGSIVNPIFPAPVAARGVTMCRVSDAVLGAMGKALPKKWTAAGCGYGSVIQAGGIDERSQRRYVGVLGGPFRGGMGARPTKDGIDVSDHDVSNSSHIPIEVTEAELPVLYRKIGMWTDSGGAGKWRGGLGWVTDVEWLSGEAILMIRRERHKFMPYGVQGGHHAPVCVTQIIDAEQLVHDLPAKIVQPIQAGEVFRCLSTGGGGYGAPHEREAARVLEDVRNGYVSNQAARDVYGVMISNGAVDEAATKARREELSAEGM